MGNGAPDTGWATAARQPVARQHPHPELTPVLEWLRRDCGAESALVTETSGEHLQLLGAANPPQWLKALLERLPRSSPAASTTSTTGELGLVQYEHHVTLMPLGRHDGASQILCLIHAEGNNPGTTTEPDATAIAALREHLHRLLRAREEARAQTAHLARAELLQDTLNALETPLSACDSRGRILAVNDALCHLLEARRSDVVGHSVDEFLGGDATALMEHLHQQPAGDALARHRRWRVRDKQGRDLDITVRPCGPIRDESADRPPERLLLRWRYAAVGRGGTFLRDARAMILERVARREPVTTTLSAICELAAGYWPETLAIISVPRPQGGRLLVAPDLPPHFRRGLEDHHDFEPGESLCATVAATGERHVCADVRSEDRWPDYSWFAVAHGIHAVWGEPLRIQSGATVGVLTLFRRQPGPPDSGQLDTMRRLAELAAVTVSHADFLEELESQAFHDGLTGLPNRRLLSDRLAHQIRQARRTRRPVGVLLLDVDGFKAVNDQYGHEAGDELLCRLAEAFASVLRPGDTLARLGGDEFVVVAPLGRPTDATSIAEKLIGASETAGGDYDIGLSVGISLFPDHGDSERPLLHRADRAMYQAKRKGKHRWSVYAERKRPR
ncbi:diguanylate cyclase [Aquisalimonas sp. 2447]|uniref:diguanylate cyclase domain-containing protein n=1 Tax=Aquisalimonas sp. 2447 TaxID=2740807 RepID=UPI0014324E55|nr:diguanylate cyclase [Aquisalimonas sp. 2447]QIT56358.1 diguanylate cyclase [Aquisalimonas sp. 2447]